jgi:hypothetical protein
MGADLRFEVSHPFAKMPAKGWGTDAFVPHEWNWESAHPVFVLTESAP